MKKLLKRIILILLPLSVLSSVIGAETATVQRSIYVNGEAVVNVVPNEVILTIGVETSDKILKTAKLQNDKAIKAIKDVITRNSIDLKFVQTDYFTVEPRSETRYSETERKDVTVFLGYFIRKNMTITLKDISKYEDVISGVLESGANYVEGIEFRTTELRKYRDQARLMAIKAAKEKAVLLANEVGLKIGKATSITEGSGGYYSMYGYNYRGNRQNIQSQNMSANSDDGPGNPSEESTIAPGQISVSARVSVVFELE